MSLLFLPHVLYSTLIDWLIFKGKVFDWFAWISHCTLRNTVNSLRSLIKLCSACGKQNAAIKDCKRCLFIVSKIIIILSSLTKPEFINQQPWTGCKIFLSLKYLFQCLLTSDWFHFFTRVLKSNLMEIQPFKDSSNKFFFLYCRLLDPYFNENVLRQRGLNKHS